MGQRELRMKVGARDRDASAGGGGVPSVIQSIRLVHWTKNLLVFGPLLFAGLAASPSAWRAAALAFFSLCLVASSCYLFNDSMDRGADRDHPDKRSRPIARAQLSRSDALMYATVFLGCGLSLAADLSLSVLSQIAVYAAVSCGYTIILKRVAFVDCIVLATLLCIRLWVGATAASAPLSMWLVMSAFPAFFSLGLSKRYAEFVRSFYGRVPGRSYEPADFLLARVVGFSSGAASSVVLYAYVASGAYDADVYIHPSWLWLAPPILLAGLCRLWNAACSGKMHSDPLVYSWKDPLAIALAAAMVCIFILATT